VEKLAGDNNFVTGARRPGARARGGFAAAQRGRRGQPKEPETELGKLRRGRMLLHHSVRPRSFFYLRPEVNPIFAENSLFPLAPAGPQRNRQTIRPLSRS